MMINVLKGNIIYSSMYNEVYHRCFGKNCLPTGPLKILKIKAQRKCCHTTYPYIYN